MMTEKKYILECQEVAEVKNHNFFRRAFERLKRCAIYKGNHILRFEFVSY